MHIENSVSLFYSCGCVSVCVINVLHSHDISNSILNANGKMKQKNEHAK